MKRLIILILLTCTGISANAEHKISGSFDILKKESRINFVLDFSKAHIFGMSEADFAKHEEDWYKDQPQINGYFLEELNDKLEKITRFGKYPEANYTLKINVIEVSHQGSFDCNVILSDKEGNILGEITDLIGEEASWGTKLYHIKCGAGEYGEKPGKILKKLLK